jgi:hypothetical protein
MPIRDGAIASVYGTRHALAQSEKARGCGRQPRQGRTAAARSNDTVFLNLVALIRRVPLNGWAGSPPEDILLKPTWRFVRREGVCRDAKCSQGYRSGCNV